MTRKEKSIGSVLLNMKDDSKSLVSVDKKRLLKYKIFSLAFSYPGTELFQFLPQFKKQKQKMIREYDLLFRSKSIWLYTIEYLAEGTFQKSYHLSRIMGFYKAFGLETTTDRPDSLSAEFEFMHCLIFKRKYAIEKKLKDFQEKASLCLDAESKFFNEYIYLGAKAIAEKIITDGKGSLYIEIAKDMLIFLEQENNLFKKLQIAQVR